MSLRSIICAFTLAFGAACTRTPSVADIAKGSPALASLHDVTLGMRASRLTSKRPNAVAAPYSGFRESVAGYSILYEVPGSVQDGQAPPPSERLASVIATQMMPSADSTFRRWHAEVVRIAAIRQSRPRCFGITRGARADSGAIWSVPGGDFVAFAHAIPSGDGDSARSWIEFAVAPNADHLRAIFGFVDEHACPSEFRAPAG